MKQNITIKINAWIICAILVIANLTTLGFWQPWSNHADNGRTIAITGSTTIETEPDQFVFSPYYQKTNVDHAAINTELSALSKTIVDQLKALGVSDTGIKTDVNSYDYSIYYGSSADQNTTTLYITVTVNDKDLAQSVQDYLITTSPSGSITPQVSFSVTKQKELEISSRNAALADAKLKADATANQLGAKIGKVVKVSDVTSGGITPFPWLSYDSGSKINSAVDSTSSSSSYSIQPGLNTYNFSVEVTYELQ